MTQISGWGNYPKIDAEIFSFDFADDIKRKMQKVPSLIPRGNGRSYGDSSLASHVASSLKYNRFLAYDPETGVLKCEAGVLLADVLDLIIPDGWFLPVTPGTKYISVGGAVASDVHGKNHHKEGSFSNHTLGLKILCADGSIINCSKSSNHELFQATCGGMGLTGIILEVEFKLKKIASSYITQKQLKARNLDEIIALFQEHEDVTYSMAWIDCLKGGKRFGRSIMMTGEHAPLNELTKAQRKLTLFSDNKTPLSIPFNFPSFALNQYSIKAFNMLYYHKNIKKLSQSIVPYNPFFYPLDAILHWNRMYGKKGFVQYQFVLPMETSKKGLIDILGRIRQKGLGSFLAVLKLFGEQNDLIAFPMRGFTLALDFPVRKGLFEFLDELDKVVVDYGGRIYMTKDARMKAEILSNSYPRLSEFIEIVNKYNPEHKFASLQSKRLNLT
ncbi:MAG: FAD-binding oxidoreductase [Fulvivirga sp.]|nr:FAD-binding oxidoreductase [Fulvivirga sp.]